MIFRRPYRELERKLGYRFRDTALLTLALTHPTHRFENDPTGGDNQRLEFLGDAVLGLLAAEYLYEVLPMSDEGNLTFLRGRLTCTETLGQIAAAIDLGAELKFGRGEIKSGGARRTGTLADALEAVIGAAYLDRGTPAARSIFDQLFRPHALTLAENGTPGNPKGELQELLQRTRHEVPRYRVLAESGAPHARTYRVGVFAGDEQLADATASNKQAAERDAAAKALSRLAGEAAPSY